MGTLYEPLENERLAIIDKFNGNRIVAFPQTITFDESRHARHYLAHIRKVYERHNDLHLVAREHMSYLRMREYFPNTDVRTTPDIVLSLPAMTELSGERRGLFFCMRDDKEGMFDKHAIEAITNIAGKQYDEVRFTDTVVQRSGLMFEEGASLFKSKIAELSRARLVVTDRIHGMIFCALSGTPCIALDNSNGKVGKEFKWLEGLPYMRFAHSIDEAVGIINGPVPEPGKFPSEEFAPLFEPLAELFLN